MIDEKKIEEAKEAFIADKKILGIVAINDLACGFKEGANWALEQFLKDLWHPASEEPKLGKRVLVKINGNLSLFNSGFVVEHIRNFDDCYGIESWLYIEDLLPKKGGEE